MSLAFGLFRGNFGCSCMVIVVRKFVVRGPQRPCGSIAKGISAVFEVSSSPIVMSPGIGGWVVVEGLFRGKRLFLSNDCKCRSAAAMRVEMTFSVI